jgi:hypothetical protein
MNRKHTAWKKSRKFGDIYGGRKSLRMTDSIFERAHSLKRPSIGDELPFLIEDNPSRDFFFPVSVEEVNEAIKELPKDDYRGITHIWLRRIKKSDFVTNEQPLAEFICGSGVRVIILYPWPKDMCIRFAKKPSSRRIKESLKYGIQLEKVHNVWVFEWNLPALRKFYINGLLYHEVGHHVDWYFRHWSKANSKKLEDFAEHYAVQKSTTGTYVFNRIEKRITNNGKSKS